MMRQSIKPLNKFVLVTQKYDMMRWDGRINATIQDYWVFYWKYVIHVHIHA